MNPENVLTDDLAERFAQLLTEAQTIGDNNASAADAQDFARRAREIGIVLVDPSRQRSLIDERVYAGVLFRLRRANTRIEALIAEVRRVAAERDDARRQLDNDAAACLDDEAPGDFEGCEGTS